MSFTKIHSISLLNQGLLYSLDSTLSIYARVNVNNILFDSSPWSKPGITILEYSNPLNLIKILILLTHIFCTFFRDPCVGAFF